MLDNFKTLGMQQANFLHQLVGIVVAIAGSLFSLACVCALAGIFFDELIAPLKLRERTYLFLELIETAFQRGQSVAQTILSLSAMREKSLGVHFHLLAAHLQNGLSLAAALERVPQFVAPEVRAMLKAGETIGDVRKVLPACRHTIEQGTSKAQTGLNTSVIVLFVAPIGAIILWVMTIWVFPRLKMISLDFLGAVPPKVDLLFSLSSGLGVLVSVLWLFMLVFGMGHKSGIGFFARQFTRLWPLTDRLNDMLPWRRRRMQRDFSAMLAILLDSDVPEPKAVELAAESTANHIFVRRGKRVLADLEKGVKLPEAVRWIDSDGEFQWRLQNAVAPRHGFQASLAGWHESLEAKAFQQEQIFSQTITSGFIFLNGLMVALTAMGVFLILLAIIDEAPLW